MKTRSIIWIITLAVLAALAMPVRLAAQKQQKQEASVHHYKLIDMGTLGGPGSSPVGDSRDINFSGLATAEVDTSIPDPYAPNCFQGCLVDHAITWQNGIQTDLGALPGGNNSSIPLWINDQGTIVGFSENGVIDPLTGFPELSAVLWQGGRILDLGTLGGNASYAFAINNQGRVVGGALNTISDSNANGLQAFGFPVVPFSVATQIRAFFWQDGVMHDLGTLGSGNDAAALLVNNRGQVAGVSFTDTILNASGFPTQDPFFWENGKMVDIGTLGGTVGFPQMMNNRGQVVGITNDANEANHAFLWDKNEGLKDLGDLPGGNNSQANWINDAGEIVGGSDATNFFHAVLWRNGVIIDLGAVAGDVCSVAASINSGGQIVGVSRADCNQDTHGFLSENGGPLIDLQTLIAPGSDITVTSAVDINDRGEIVASGMLPNGDFHSVLLIPCDENHPDVAGCDYDTVDAITAAQVHPAQTAPSAAAASFSNLSPTERKTRIRFMMANRNRRFGALPPK